DVRSGDHLFVSHTRSDHREHTGIRVDHHFKKRRSVVVHEFLEHRLHTIFLTHPDGKLKSVSASGINKILTVKELFGTAETFREEHFLPLPHHTVALIIEENRLQRQIVVCRGFHLADVHAQTSVTINIDDETIRTRKLGADSSRQTESHGPHRTRREK